MTENATRKPGFTRRNVILGSAALVVVLAVALVVFGGNSTGSVRTTLMGFEKSADQRSFLAVFDLTNETAMAFILLSQGVDDAVLGRFHPLTGNKEGFLGRIGSHDLKPHSARRVKVLLPSDGRTGRVEVYLCTTRLMPSGPVRRLREWWRSKVPFRAKMPRALCDQEIQFPLLLLDGMVQPPRLLSGPDVKR